MNQSIVDSKDFDGAGYPREDVKKTKDFDGVTGFREENNEHVVED